MDNYDYRALYEKQQRDLEDVERRIQEDRRREDAEKRVSKTTLFEFLNICHHSIFMKYHVQKYKSFSNTGGLTRMSGKLYPRYLKPWTNFSAQHEVSFAAFETAFQQQPPLFSSPDDLDFFAIRMSHRTLACEEDLKTFEYMAVESFVLDVMRPFLKLVQSGVATIPGVDAAGVDALSSFSFNKSPFGVVSGEYDDESSEEDLDLDQPAYLHAIAAAMRQMDMLTVHPGKLCFRHSTDGTKRPLFIIEYKAAHKIDEEFMRQTIAPDVSASLMEDFIRELSETSTNKDSKFMAKCDVVEIFVQTYNCMVDYGLQYSYATTGYALIFFYLDPEQPSTLFYHMEEPMQAVQSTDRESVKQSAVALVLAFMLTAMTGQYMTHQWKKSVIKTQPRWPSPYADMNVSSATTGASMVPMQASTAFAATASDAKEAPVWSVPVDAPLTPALPYCTQACLLGLKKGSAKDVHCPNVLLHQRRDAHGDVGEEGDRHPISAKTFCELLVQQLADNMDHDFHSLERFGMYSSTWVLFKVALSAYGYCFVGKGVQGKHREWLASEDMAYGYLEAFQGRLVPVNLGIIELVDEYWTGYGAHISHMMLMAFAGESLWHLGRKANSPKRDYSSEIDRTLGELKPFGVLYDDNDRDIMTWNDELQSVMAINFDHERIIAAMEEATGQAAEHAG